MKRIHPSGFTSFGIESLAH